MYIMYYVPNIKFKYNLSVVAFNAELITVSPRTSLEYFDWSSTTRNRRKIQIYVPIYSRIIKYEVYNSFQPHYRAFVLAVRLYFAFEMQTYFV